MKDDKRKFAGGNGKIDRCADVLTAEALALRFGLSLAQRAGCNRLVINSDNQEVIDTMNDKDDRRVRRWQFLTMFSFCF